MMPIDKALNTRNEDDDFDIPDFDFDNAVPNRFAGRFAEGAAYEILGLDGIKRIYIQIDADLVEKFSSPKSVNDTLRLAMKNEAKKSPKVGKNKN